MDRHLHLLANGVVNLSLGSLDGRLHKRVGIAGEYQREAHFVAIDADAVGQHFALDEIFLRARVDHFLQGIGNQFGIQLHIVVIFGQRYEDFSAFSQSNRLKRLITPRQDGSSPILRLAV